MTETLIDAGSNPSQLQPADYANLLNRDLDTFEADLLDTCEFALDDDGEVIDLHIRRFMSKYT